jgi:hypothetical protein
MAPVTLRSTSGAGAGTRQTVQLLRGRSSFQLHHIAILHRNPRNVPQRLGDGWKHLSLGQNPRRCGAGSALLVRRSTLPLRGVGPQGMLRHGRGRPTCWSRNHLGRHVAFAGGPATTGSATLSGVFINYRREDSGGHAGRLYDRLRQHYGSDRVFRDIDAIAPGVDFAQRIEAAIGTCDAVVVLIGRDWLDVRGPDGRRRLDDPGDVLRREIAAALGRGILVIPVLVEGATMPSEHQLPSDVAPLARRNALELSDTRWDYDVGRLQQALDQVVDRSSQATAPAATVAGRTGSRSPLAGIALLIVGGLLVAGVVFGGRFIFDIWQQATREADMTISPASGPSGTTVAASGSGFQPGETIELRVHTDRVAEIRADRDGRFSGVRFQVRDPLGGSFPSDRQITVSATGRSSIKHAEEPFELRH